MPQNYTTGTVTVSNGSAVVTGSGTAWELSLVTGGLFCCAGYSVPIASVESDTSLTLALVWPGANGSGTAYAIFRETAQAASAVEANDRLAEVAERLRALSYIAFDASGTLAQRDTYDAAAKDFIYLRTDSDPFELYIKASAASGDWAGPNLYGQGAQGIPGPVAPFTFSAPDALAPGAIPTVTNEGTPTAPDLKFGIPIGEGFYWKGAYSGATAYQKDDVVRDNGSSWIALQATTGNAPPVLPTTSNAWWELLAPKGQDGLGTGDVVGPAGAEADRIAVFDGTTGKLLKDGGQVLAALQAALTGVDNIELGSALSGDRISHIDFHASDGVDRSAGIIRLAGVNGDFLVQQTGTGVIDVVGGSDFRRDGNAIYHAGNLTHSTIGAQADLGWKPVGIIQPSSDVAAIVIAVPAGASALRITGLLVSTADAVAFRLRVSQDGGATYLSSASYRVAYFNRADAAMSQTSGTYVTETSFYTAVEQQNSGQASSVDVRLDFVTGRAARWRSVSSAVDVGGKEREVICTGSLANVAPVTHLQIFPASGNISTATRLLVEAL